MGAPLFVFGEEERGDLTQRAQRKRAEFAEKRNRNPRAQPGMAVPREARWN
jgi:hypothetical protein